MVVRYDYIVQAFLQKKCYIRTILFYHLLLVMGHTLGPLQVGL